MNGNSIRVTYILICEREKKAIEPFGFLKKKLPPSVLQDSRAYLNSEIMAYMSYKPSSAKTAGQ